MTRSQPMVKYNKHSIEFVAEQFASRQCKLLETEYKGQNEKMLYIAACGHENKVDYARFRRGFGETCNKCSYHKAAKGRFAVKVDDKHAEAVALFEQNGCKLLSKYEHSKTDIEYIAQCGHKETTTYNTFQSGCGRLCSNCAYKERGKRIWETRIANDNTANPSQHREDRRETIEKFGCKYLFEEKDFDSVHYIAVCGHRAQVGYLHFKKQEEHMCSKCLRSKSLRKSYQEIYEFFSDNGCILTSSEYKTCFDPLEFIAQCGHKNTSNYANFSMGRSRLCKKCINKRYSNISIEWLNGIMATENIFIQHIQNSVSEFRVPGTRYTADGYCKDTNTIYEFNGDLWHGNPNVFKPEDLHPITRVPFGELYDKTKKKEAVLKSLGYNVISIWESDYLKEKKEK